MNPLERRVRKLEEMVDRLREPVAEREPFDHAGYSAICAELTRRHRDWASQDWPLQVLKEFLDAQPGK